MEDIFKEMLVELRAIRKHLEKISADTTDDNSSLSDSELYEKAKMLVTDAGMASTSHIQRVLGIGYARAVRLMDLLEEKGVIEPNDGTLPRRLALPPAAVEVLKQIEAQLKKKKKKKSES